MLGRKEKQILGCMVIIFAVIMVLGNVNTVVASRRKRINPRIENITSRKAEFNGQFFDLYINQDEMVIIIRGEVGDWRELDRVEKHFNIVAPSEYELICDIQVGY